MEGQSRSPTIGQARPLLLAVDVDPTQLDRIEGALQRSFGSDFRVRGEATADDALGLLDIAHDLGQRVAVVLVDHALPEEQRAELFDRARTLHPDARRALLIEWGAWADRGTASATLATVAVGDINYTSSSRGSSATSYSTGRSLSSCRSGRAARSGISARWS